MRQFYCKPQGMTVWEHTQTGEVEVARIVGTSRPVTARRGEARLFAAAPDLLHLLHLALPHVQVCVGYDLSAAARADDLGMAGSAATIREQARAREGLVDLIRAAIAKAEGGV